MLCTINQSLTLPASQSNNAIDFTGVRDINKFFRMAMACDLENDREMRKKYQERLRDFFIEKLDGEIPRDQLNEINLYTLASEIVKNSWQEPVLMKFPLIQGHSYRWIKDCGQCGFGIAAINGIFWSALNIFIGALFIIYELSDHSINDSNFKLSLEGNNCYKLLFMPLISLCFCYLLKPANEQQEMTEKLYKLFLEHFKLDREIINIAQDAALFNFLIDTR